MSDKLKYKIPAVISYPLIAICLALVAFGIRDLSLGKLEDGLLNIVIGSSLISTGLSFDYTKAKGWQRFVFLGYGLVLTILTIALIYTIFTK